HLLHGETQRVESGYFAKIWKSSSEFPEANFAQQVSNLTGLKTKAFKGTAAAVFPGFLVPNMEVGKIYQPMISMRTLRNTGIFKYFPSSQRNYNPVIFFPENHSAIRRN
ncbi:hypothetical protein, partial [Pseudomonas helleri]|uniref:hypothetical protein n=1 Tax=Pseudomonas helleri TaxID=1608996 RepID=UPI001886198D